MFIKQLSIFLENREGRLDDVTEVLVQNNINILSLSLADTSEYGMLRLLVSEPEKARDVLKAGGFSANLVDVASVKISNKVGSLQKFLRACNDSKLNIEYMYVLSTGSDEATIIVKFSDAALAADELKKAGY